MRPTSAGFRESLESTAVLKNTECPYCSGPGFKAYHNGACSRVAAIEYYPNGTVKRVELREPASGVVSVPPPIKIFGGHTWSGSSG